MYIDIDAIGKFIGFAFIFYLCGIVFLSLFGPIFEAISEVASEWLDGIKWAGKNPKKASKKWVFNIFSFVRFIFLASLWVGLYLGSGLILTLIIIYPAVKFFNFDLDYTIFVLLPCCLVSLAIAHFTDIYVKPLLYVSSLLQTKSEKQSQKEMSE